MKPHLTNNLDDHQIMAFYAQNAVFNKPLYESGTGWLIFTVSTLTSDDAWAYFMFRYMGEYNIDDMYLIATTESGDNTYALLVSRCQP